MLLANAGDAGLIPGSERSLGEGNGNPHPSILDWEIPWTEEPDWLVYGVAKETVMTCK